MAHYAKVLDGKVTNVIVADQEFFKTFVEIHKKILEISTKIQNICDKFYIFFYKFLHISRICLEISKIFQEGYQNHIIF